MGTLGRIKGVYGGPVAAKLQVEVTPEILGRLGKCLVDSFIKESKKDFAKRGWSGEARDGSAPIWDSFSYKIHGTSTIEIVSTWPDIDVLTTRDIPPRKMTWLTQEAKDKNPDRYPLSPAEQLLGMKQHGRVLSGRKGPARSPLTGRFLRRSETRLPLVVPLKTDGGRTVFRMAPLKFQDAWVHPGIARFTFVERAVKAGKAGCLRILKEEALMAVVAEMSK